MSIWVEAPNNAWEIDLPVLDRSIREWLDSNDVRYQAWVSGADYCYQFATVSDAILFTLRFDRDRRLADLVWPILNEEQHQ